MGCARSSCASCNVLHAGSRSGRCASATAAVPSGRCTGTALRWRSPDPADATSAREGFRGSQQHHHASRLGLVIVSRCCSRPRGDHARSRHAAPSIHRPADADRALAAIRSAVRIGRGGFAACGCTPADPAFAARTIRAYAERRLSARSTYRLRNQNAVPCFQTGREASSAAASFRRPEARRRLQADRPAPRPLPHQLAAEPSPGAGARPAEGPQSGAWSLLLGCAQRRHEDQAARQLWRARRAPAAVVKLGRASARRPRAGTTQAQTTLPLGVRDAGDTSVRVPRVTRASRLDPPPWRDVAAAAHADDRRRRGRDHQASAASRYRRGRRCALAPGA